MCAFLTPGFIPGDDFIFTTQNEIKCFLIALEMYSKRQWIMKKIIFDNAKHLKELEGQHETVIK